LGSTTISYLVRSFERWWWKRDSEVFSNHFSEVSWSRPKLDGVEFPLYRRAIIAFFVVFGRGD
jgi:hypothetical protein